MTLEEKVRLFAAELVQWRDDGEGDRGKALERLNSEPEFWVLTETLTQRILGVVREVVGEGRGGVTV